MFPMVSPSTLTFVYFLLMLTILEFRLWYSGSLFHFLIWLSESEDETQGLLTLTENTRKLTLTEKPWGTFILASTFEDDKTAAETHYDAVWLRDSLWGYMALVSDQGNSVAAKKVLLTLWGYMSTPDQIKRMQDIISNPKRLDGILILPT